MSAGQVIDLDYENFDDEVYGNDKPVLVEFWSESCYACRQLDGIVDALADEFQDKIIFGRVDMDANWDTAGAYQVKTAPTVLLFQNDQVVQRMDGPKTRAEYRQSLCELIAQYWVI
jgi:thioredoxin 1